MNTVSSCPRLTGCLWVLVIDIYWSAVVSGVKRIGELISTRYRHSWFSNECDSVKFHITSKGQSQCVCHQGFALVRLLVARDGLAVEVLAFLRDRRLANIVDFSHTSPILFSKSYRDGTQQNLYIYARVSHDSPTTATRRAKDGQLFGPEEKDE